MTRRRICLSCQGGSPWPPRGTCRNARGTEHRRHSLHLANRQAGFRQAVRRCRQGHARLDRETRRPRQGRDGGRVPAKACIPVSWPGRAISWHGPGPYRRYPVVARAIDQCAAILEPLLGLDLRKVVFGDPAEAGPRLQATALAQPALFSVSFSIAALWRSLGFEPAAMLGHSVGEFVAATLAGVMRLEDALTVVAARGAMMQELPEGAMLAVMLGEPELEACSRSPRSMPMPSALSPGRVPRLRPSRRS